MKVFTRFIVLLAVLMGAVLPMQAGKVKDSKTTYAKDALQPFVDSGQLSGAISVLYDNGIQETCCIGYADVAAKRRIKMDNVFMQCSQTKGFCGVTIAKLVEEGKISLDDPVSKYLPEFETLWVLDEDKDGIRKLHKAKNVLTIRMVMNHTGGFPFEKTTGKIDGRDSVIPVTLETNVIQLHKFLFDDDNYKAPESVREVSSRRHEMGGLP